MRCDFKPTGELNANGVNLYQCVRPGCGKGPWPSPSGKINARCRAAGLGDAVAVGLRMVHRGYIEECGGCKERKRVLNDLGNSVIARLHVKSSGGLGSIEPSVQVGLPP
jgi:hypothetical protein